MSGTYGLSYFGVGQWGIGGGETGTFSSTSGAEVTAINNIYSFGEATAVSGMEGQSISTVLGFATGPIYSTVTAIPHINWQGFGSSDALVSGDGVLTIAWDSIEDTSTTWTEIEIV